MHDYLCAVGFSNVTAGQEEDLIKDVVSEPSGRSITKAGGITVAEFRKEYGALSGVAVRGEFDEDHHFRVWDYYPYFSGKEVSTKEQVSMERHSNRNSYAGILEDVRIGATMVFFLQNLVPYIRSQKGNMLDDKTLEGVRNVTLSCLSRKGTILLPVERTEAERRKEYASSMDRNRLIAAAREGDEEAIENLTLDDLDLYTSLSNRVITEDILTIVNTTFMPSGIESEEYYLIGEITKVEEVINPKTQEKLYELSVNCNGMKMDIIINRNDLLGEPKVDRRFRGDVWLQGEVDFG